MAEFNHVLSRATDILFDFTVIDFFFLTLKQGSSGSMKTLALILSLCMTRADSHNIAWSAAFQYGKVSDESCH